MTINLKLRKIFKDYNKKTYLFSTKLDRDPGEGNFQVVCLEAALDVRDGVLEMLLDLLSFF